MLSRRKEPLEQWAKCIERLIVDGKPNHFLELPHQSNPQGVVYE
jgi:hypothetical protein